MSALLFVWLAAGFLEDQLSFPRVRDAKAHVDASLRREVVGKGFAYPPKNVLFRVFKREKRLEIWADKKGRLEQVKSYVICASSGTLGPKMRGGDGQVPEGIYTLSAFNPSSSYHLSLRVSYPNTVDRARATALFGRVPSASEIGGDIFIHGDCVTIGCVPLTDPMVEEVYWLAALAKNAGQRTIPVHVFPAQLDATTLAELLLNNPSEHAQLLWRDLAPIYQRFEAEHRIPPITLQGEHYLVH